MWPQVHVIDSDDEDSDEEAEDQDEWDALYYWKDAHSGLKPSPLDGELSDDEIGPDKRVAHQDATLHLARMLQDFDNDNIDDEDWVPLSVASEKARTKLRRKGKH